MIGFGDHKANPVEDLHCSWVETPRVHLLGKAAQCDPQKGIDVSHAWFVVSNESVSNRLCGVDEAIAFQNCGNMTMAPTTYIRTVHFERIGFIQHNDHG